MFRFIDPERGWSVDLFWRRRRDGDLEWLQFRAGAFHYTETNGHQQYYDNNFCPVPRKSGCDM